MNERIKIVDDNEYYKFIYNTKRKLIEEYKSRSSIPTFESHDEYYEWLETPDGQIHEKEIEKIQETLDEMIQEKYPEIYQEIRDKIKNIENLLEDDF